MKQSESFHEVLNKKEGKKTNESSNYRKKSRINRGI